MSALQIAEISATVFTIVSFTAWALWTSVDREATMTQEWSDFSVEDLPDRLTVACFGMRFSIEKRRTQWLSGGWADEAAWEAVGRMIIDYIRKRYEDRDA